MHPFTYHQAESAADALRAQEKLGWRLGVEAYTFHKFTFFETVEKTAQLGLPYVGGLNFQKVSKEIPKNFDPALSDEELLAIIIRVGRRGKSAIDIARELRKYNVTLLIVDRPPGLLGGSVA